MLKLMKQIEQLMTTYGKMLQYVEQLLKTNEKNNEIGWTWLDK